MKRVACPCCGLPSLEGEDFEICRVCWWEDDGQNDDDADEVRGGPNYQYSLTHARRNFIAHGHMYDEGKGIEVVEKPSAARLALLEYVHNVGSGKTVWDQNEFEAFLTAEWMNT